MLGAVLRELERYELPVIVVDDGATDGTSAVLDRWAAAPECRDLRRVVRHTTNRGKAAALCSGFAEAARLGYTHVATMDTDGQHEVADLVNLTAVSARHPGSLILGARARRGVDVPLASRVGRCVSNGLVWLESGVSVADSQSGMRVYPLEHVAALAGRAPRYGYETEVLVRAGWHGVAIEERPIRCIYRVPGGRTTHFRLWGDTLACACMHARLLARALFPGPVRLGGTADRGTGTIPRRLGQWFSPRRLRQMARGSAASRERLSASVGVGLLMATLPIYGFKTVACLWLAGRFRLHPLAVVSVSSLCTPPLGLAFVALSICVGGFLMHGRPPDLSAIDLQEAGRWSALNTLIAEWLLGSVIAGSLLGVLGYALTRLLLARSSPADDCVC